MITAGSIPNNSNASTKTYFTKIVWSAEKEEEQPKMGNRQKCSDHKESRTWLSSDRQKTPSPPKKKVKHWEDYRKPKKKGENEIDKRKEKKLFTKNSFILLHKL